MLFWASPDVPKSFLGFVLASKLVLQGSNIGSWRQGVTATTTHSRYAAYETAPRATLGLLIGDSHSRSCRDPFLVIVGSGFGWA
ncbi:hypothetical protein QBC36DRAFT_323240 [Triangularia setosa]|uniref:Uncharacterized protein n=1 Tax=Triangularia setosa TaxID=2587417 RepID=A0AAN6WBU3_9PEZI|nr:hypothetical protein QBC36DRAFT_323240 [Podospora setosa]